MGKGAALPKNVLGVYPLLLPPLFFLKGHLFQGLRIFTNPLLFLTELRSVQRSPGRGPQWAGPAVGGARPQWAAEQGIPGTWFACCVSPLLVCLLC